MLLSEQLFRLLSYTTGDHLPRDGTAPSGLNPPMSIITQENAPETSLQASLSEASSQVRLPLPR